MRALNILLAVLISFLLALVIFEGGLRLFGFAPPSTINEFHDKLGWAKRPGAVAKRSTRELDITFEINPYGLRDDSDTSPEKKANTFRVMMLGDSFVLGYTVDREDLFVDQLEGWWASEERRVEVINAGTEGYSTDQEVLWFREYGRDYRPDLVLVFPYLNDIYWNGQGHYQRFPKPLWRPDGSVETGMLVDPGKGPLPTRSAIGRFLGWILAPSRLSGPHTFQPEGAQEPLLREFAPLLTREPDFLADAVARTKGALLALARDCDEIGARLILVAIPPETAIHEDERERFRVENLANLPDEQWDPNRPVNLFLSLAKDLGIETIDPRPALLARADAGERLYFHDEWHFNPRGNVAMTKLLYAELDNRQAFPPEHGAVSKGALPIPADEDGLPTWLKVYGALWLLLSVLYLGHYRDEPIWQPPLKVAGLLALIFTIAIGGGKLLQLVPPRFATIGLSVFVVGILGFIAWKLGRRLATILELIKAFTLRGHWYLMPLVVVLLTIGSLLVVAASSPLVAPFIYTLF